jgi:hypothetical protein
VWFQAAPSQRSIPPGEGADRLNIVGVDFYCYAAHDGVQGEDHAEVVLLADQHTLNAGHRSSLDSHSFSYGQVWMRLDLAFVDAKT